ncbi:hypothetical protein K1T71_000107, partial [Dendrolimus kikuchii]
SGTKGTPPTSSPSGSKSSESVGVISSVASAAETAPGKNPAGFLRYNIAQSLSLRISCQSAKTRRNRPSTSCTAPHMLGNELNPESGAAARLQEQLSAELAAHAAGSAGSDPLGTSGSSGRSSSGTQSLDQLLERQWEQGSQFLMEQAQHFDIASLLSCLHQLRTENVRLEEHVGSLLQRRDHLLAVNARLAIPLTTVTSGPPEPSRCTRESGSQARPPPAPIRAAETITSERSHQLIMREVQQKPS